MTDQEIARALERMIREDAKLPPEEQVRDLIAAGVIDEQGRFLIGAWNMNQPNPHDAAAHGPSNASSPDEAAGTDVR
jgi:hypothetical protein